MAFEIGTAVDHNDLLDKIRIFVSSTLPLAQRHTVLRNTNELSPVGDAVNEKTLIFQAPGLSGTDQIFYGLKIYKSVSSDIYNTQIDGFTGYVSGNTFESQPGSTNGTGLTGIGVTLWNQTIPYWLVADGQGFTCFAKIQNTYVSFGAGFCLKYATFGQYPYPLVVHGNLATSSLTRYSVTSWFNGWKGSLLNLKLRSVTGIWISPQCLPYIQSTIVRNTAVTSGTADGYYGLVPINLSTIDTIDTNITNIYGALANLYFISGFNNAVENTLVYNGVTYVILRDGTRTGFLDYITLALV